MHLSSCSRPVRSMLCALLLVSAALAPATAVELRLPADCKLGEDCFFQQFPDMKAGDGATDPFCGVATYDGHNGVDLRILSMRDIDRGVPVVAAADGEVLRGRDGVEDRLIETDAQRKAIMPRACGNGVIVAHANGVETQYCHLRKGSIVVKPGQKLKAGDRIGDIGASGLAQFPHVELTVRVDGKQVDPLTGLEVGKTCISDMKRANPLFSAEVMRTMRPQQPEILALGMAGSTFEYDSLVVNGPPVSATTSDPARVAWAWLANMRPGDRLSITLNGPDGQTIAENTTDPLDVGKAVYLSYTGKKGGPVPGIYRLEVSVIRDGKPFVSRKREITIQ